MRNTLLNFTIDQYGSITHFPKSLDKNFSFLRGAKTFSDFTTLLSWEDCKNQLNGNGFYTQSVEHDGNAYKLHLNPLNDQFILSLSVDEVAELKEDYQQFSYIVSHDLQGPMRSLSSLLTWLEEDSKDDLNEQCRTHLQMMKTQVKKLNSQFDGVLEYSRIGRMHINAEQLDLHEILNELVAELDIKDKLIVDPLPEIQANPKRIKQLFYILLENAKKAKEEKLQVEIAAHENEFDLQFHVIDFGKGIEAKYADKIFDIFYTLGYPEDGDGLGLSYAKKIVQSYGGNIWLNTECKDCTEFIFTLEKSMVCI